MGVSCSHGNQTKRQIAIILIIFKDPYASNILTKLETNHFSGFGGVVVNGRTIRRTDDGQKVITIAHPEHSSGELKRVREKSSECHNYKLPPFPDTKRKRKQKKKLEQCFRRKTYVPPPV